MAYLDFTAWQNISMGKGGFDLFQRSLFDSCSVTDAVEQLASAGVESRGAVFTRREIVDFILDLVDYTPDRPLQKLKLLEPAFGGGDFLLPVIRRLFEAWRQSDKNNKVVEEELQDCIRAVELHKETFNSTRAKVIDLLVWEGIGPKAAQGLANRWLVNGDFLLVSIDADFDVVVGNPPYVRQELIPDVLMAEYRARYTTVYDRADLYIPFIERSLRSLTDFGAAWIHLCGIAG